VSRNQTPLLASHPSQQPSAITGHCLALTQVRPPVRPTDDLFKLIGQKPITMYDFVKLYASEFTRHGTAA